jgi:glucose 1-dehydrogenase
MLSEHTAGIGALAAFAVLLGCARRKAALLRTSSQVDTKRDEDEERSAASALVQHLAAVTSSGQGKASLPLEGRVALVTGAGRGLGRGVALALAQMGADVVVNDLPGERGSEAAGATAKHIRSRLGRSSTVALADVSDARAVDAMMEAAIRAYGRIDIVVANAAFSDRHPLTRKTMDVSQLGVLYTARAAAAQMCFQPPPSDRESRGKIVLISSIMGQLVLSSNAVAYSMSKAALIHLGKCLAAELVDQRINVNVVCPGWCDTEGERKWSSETEMQAGASLLPWKRHGTAAEVGGLVGFLCSEAANYMTGSALVIDGGYSVSVRLPGKRGGAPGDA